MMRQTGEIDVHGLATPLGRNGENGSANGWTIIDGTGKTCAGIIAALTEQVNRDKESYVEVIIPDMLNTYDVIIWAEKRNHNIITQRNDGQGPVRMLIQP